MMKLTVKNLTKLWPYAERRFVEGVVASSAVAFAYAEISTDLRLAHFMAQVSHESGGGQRLVENLKYSTAARIRAVWPTRFRTDADAAPFVRQPQALANKVYNGRLGNKLGSDDGWDYRGRGLIQITGRDNYALYGALTTLDLIGNPDLAAAADATLSIAGAFWHDRPCNAHADRDDIERVTKSINGGLIGLKDRIVWLGKWKAELIK